MALLTVPPIWKRRGVIGDCGNRRQPASATTGGRRSHCWECVGTTTGRRPWSPPSRQTRLPRHPARNTQGPEVVFRLRALLYGALAPQIYCTPTRKAREPGRRSWMRLVLTISPAEPASRPPSHRAGAEARVPYPPPRLPPPPAGKVFTRSPPERSDHAARAPLFAPLASWLLTIRAAAVTCGQPETPSPYPPRSRPPEPIIVTPADRGPCAVKENAA